MTTEKTKLIQNEESKTTVTMSAGVYELQQARQERREERLIIAIVICVIIIFLSNIAWLIYNSQFDFASSDITVGTDGEGDANFVGQDGDINNGIYQSNNTDKNTESGSEEQENSNKS